MQQAKTKLTVFFNRAFFNIKAILLLVVLTTSLTFPQVSPAPVNLGTAGEFVLLASTGISTTGTTHITGDIGVSPAAASSITGFSLIIHSSNTYSTSSVVTGKIYAADYTAPTPAKMTAAIGDMQTAYTNAAGRTLPDFSELHSGNLTGKTLTRGLYKWTTNVLVSAGGLTISGSATDIWIFQIDQNLSLGSGASVTLIGGARASNIFWQVAGQVALGTTAEMHGIILCKTKIVISTGASLNGRAFAQTAITLDANAVVQPAVIVQPTINATTPANSVTGVVLDQKINAVFSQKMDSTTISTLTFLLKRGSTPVTGAVTYKGLTATFTPAISLLPNTVYTATVTTGAKDTAGSSMVSNYVWSFTTGTAVSVFDNSTAIPAFALEQNFPNPFNPSTSIQYFLERPVHVLLKVYNLLGNEVSILVNSIQTAGSHSVHFNASEAGLNLTSGIYIYRLEAGTFIATRKLTYMK
ncbi:MAG: DUF3494 domain-containing protein [Ignavibacteriales bacterium]|nr:DUF3494 domain-containing protein [Ignavibacteriales bacterium]